MKPHPRIRKTVKWGGAVVSVLLLVVWAGSGWVFVQWMSNAGSFSNAYGGRLELGHVFSPDAPLSDTGWSGAFQRSAFEWKFQRFQNPYLSSLYLPLWLPAIISLAATTFAWRLDTLARRRARVGLCPKCNYDRSGLPPQTVCPECGAAPSVASSN